MLIINVFPDILNISITASWLIIAVVVLRLLLKKAPKTLTIIMWALVGLRLICPFTIESILSLVPSAETVPSDIMFSQNPEIHSGIQALNSVVNPIISDSFAPSPENSVNPLQVVFYIAGNIWVVGIIVMLAYLLISYLCIRRKVKISLLYKDNIYFCDNINLPFILGIFKPRIYLPSGIDEGQMQYVIRHEQAHIKRKDHIWKVLGFALLSVYWFNPVIWIAYILLCRDIEFACDEKVIKSMDNSDKKGYSEALISCSVQRRMIMACPLAFGEVGVKDRIKSVLSYKKPAFWVLVVAIVICFAVSIVFLTNPVSSNIDKIFQEKGYTITSQEFYDFTITIPKYVLNDKAYTSEGQTFEKNDVVVFETDTTTIYLKKAMISNESDDMMYLIFDFSYRNIGEYNSIIIPYYSESATAASDHIGIGLQSKNIYTQDMTYKDAVKLRGWGPSEEFIFYASTYAIKDSSHTMKIHAFANKLSYQKKSIFNLFKKDDVPPKATDDYSSINDTIDLTGPFDVYVFPESIDIGAPTIILYQNDQNCQFSFSALSSTLNLGKYTLTEDTLTLTITSGQTRIYVFDVVGDTFVFDAFRSSPIPEYRYSADSTETKSPVPDSAVFKKASHVSSIPE